jgi:hypothetical protein
MYGRWRALTQYLFQPGTALLEGLATTLSHTTLLTSPQGPQPWRPFAPATAADQTLLWRAPAEARARTATRPGFALRFSEGVAKWSEHVRRIT